MVLEGLSILAMSTGSFKTINIKPHYLWDGECSVCRYNLSIPIVFYHNNSENYDIFMSELIVLVLQKKKMFVKDKLKV